MRECSQFSDGTASAFRHWLARLSWRGWRQRLLATALVGEADAAAHDAVLAHLRRRLVLLPPRQVAGVCTGRATRGLWVRHAGLQAMPEARSSDAPSGSLFSSCGHVVSCMRTFQAARNTKQACGARPSGCPACVRALGVVQHALLLQQELAFLLLGLGLLLFLALHHKTGTSADVGWSACAHPRRLRRMTKRRSERWGSLLAGWASHLDLLESGVHVLLVLLLGLELVCRRRGSTSTVPRSAAAVWHRNRAIVCKSSCQRPRRRPCTHWPHRTEPFQPTRHRSPLCSPLTGFGPKRARICSMDLMARLQGRGHSGVSRAPRNPLRKLDGARCLRCGV